MANDGHAEGMAAKAEMCRAESFIFVVVVVVLVVVVVVVSVFCFWCMEC